MGRATDAKGEGKVKEGLSCEEEKDVGELQKQGIRCGEGLREGNFLGFGGGGLERCSWLRKQSWIL